VLLERLIEQLVGQGGAGQGAAIGRWVEECLSAASRISRGGTKTAPELRF
jgi:hypothetical protein